MSRRVLLIAVPLLLAACSGSKRASTPTTTTAPAATTTAITTTAHTTTSATVAPGALEGEALSAAAGDIPDNQMFVRYSGPAFSMKVPEGWARQASSAGTIFRDKNNIVRVLVSSGATPTVASMANELEHTKKAQVVKPPHVVQLGTSMIAATYTTTSAPNSVTGKSVTLTVDRYELAKDRKRAVVDLGTPVGVDNVDAYRMMIESLRLR